MNLGIRNFIIMCVIGLLHCSFGISHEAKVTLNFSIKNIRSTEGNIKVHVYTSQDDFEKNTPDMELFFPKSTYLKDGLFKAEINLEPGKYGLALLDDENLNKEMDYNFIGIPKEGFGFSEYYHTSLFRPTFSDFEFNFGEGQNDAIEIKMRYM